MEDLEDFSAMLDDYMDDEVIKQECGDEEEEVIDSSSYVRRTQFDDSKIISIGEFLTVYCGINPSVNDKMPKVRIDYSNKVKHNENPSIKRKIRRVKKPRIKIQEGLSHADLKEMGYKVVIPVSNDYAEEHLDYINGDILIVVSDIHGNLSTYFNPIFVMKYFELQDKSEALRVKLHRGVDLTQLGAFLEYDKCIKEQEEMCKIFEESKKDIKVRRLRKEVERYDKLQRG